MSSRRTPSSPPAAILFDFGGTLDADGRWWCVRFHDVYRAAGGTMPLDGFAPLFAASDRRLAELPGVRALGFRRTIEAQARILADLVPDLGARSAERLAFRVWADSVAMVCRNAPTLDRLRRRARLGIVSNYTGNLEPCLEELGVRSLFDVVMDSARCGVAKPDPRIFTDALAALGVEPAAAWMVGDNFEADIRPAHALGLRTVWLADPARPLPAGAGEPTARVTSLLDIEAVIGHGQGARGSARPPGAAVPCTA